VAVFATTTRELLTHDIMRVHLIGGIYGKPPQYRQTVNMTVETLLERLLIEAGVDLSTGHHRWPVPRDAELVHLHQLGRLHRSVWLHPHALVYTPHAAWRDPRRTKVMYGRLLARRASGIVALSDAEAAFQVGNLAISPHKVTVIQNGADASVFFLTPPSARPAVPPIKLLYVGQLIERKRLDVLLRAMAAVRGEVDLQLTLVFHNAALQSELRQLSNDLGLEGWVSFAGAKTPEEIARVHGDHQVLVLLSTGEGLPGCITEALLCGTLVIAQAVGGVPDQLAGTDSCLLQNPDVPAVADAFRLLPATLQAHTDEVAEQVRRQTIERFSAHTMLRAHLDLYHRVLRGEL